jgi:hypothetical protein
MSPLATTNGHSGLVHIGHVGVAIVTRRSTDTEDDNLGVGNSESHVAGEMQPT